MMTASKFRHPGSREERGQIVRFPVSLPEAKGDLRAEMENLLQSTEYAWEKLSTVFGGEWGRGGGSQVPDTDRNDYRDKWLDERFAKLDQKMEFQARIVDERLNAYGAKLDQFLGEMRDRDNQRHSEIQGIHQKIDAINRWIATLTIGAIVTILGALLTLIYSR